MLGCRHRRAEGRELADAQRLARLDRPKLQVQRCGEGERPFRPHQQPRQIATPFCPRRRRQTLDVVAAHAPQLVRKPRRDLLRLPRPQRPQPLDQIRRRRRHLSTKIVRHLAKAEPRSIRQQRIDRRDVIRHQPIANGFRPAGIIPRHPADRAALPRRRIHREKQPMPLQRIIQRAERDPRLHPHPPRAGIHLHHAAQVLRAIQHQRPVHRLPALRRPAAARQHRNAFLPAQRHRRLHILDAARHQHAIRLDLVDRRIRRIPPAIGRAEQHLAARLPPQPLGQPAVAKARACLHLDVHRRNPGTTARTLQPATS